MHIKLRYKSFMRNGTIISRNPQTARTVQEKTTRGERVSENCSRVQKEETHSDGECVVNNTMYRDLSVYIDSAGDVATAGMAIRDAITQVSAQVSVPYRLGLKPPNV